MRTRWTSQTDIMCCARRQPRATTLQLRRASARPATRKSDVKSLFATGHRQFPLDMFGSLKLWYICCCENTEPLSQKIGYNADIAYHIGTSTT